MERLPYFLSHLNQYKLNDKLIKDKKFTIVIYNSNVWHPKSTFQNLAYNK